ncbi:MAG: N-acetylmuramoyl-L-alanine amidase [Lachnospiraceae bacterium]|nr:N-acetylmuramoyl-L-alanine amidase [Lachnospiraceae bacterium]
MSKFRLGEKPLRLLILAAVTVLMLGGCAGRQYEPVEQGAVFETTAAAENTERMAFTIGETTEAAVGADQANAGEDTTEASETEARVYEEVHDWVVVTADVLNVRETDSTDARIYVQLKNGDVLERTGYHEEWSRVIYDDGEAYVASDMIEVTEEPAPEETTAEETAEAATEDGAVVAAAVGAEASAAFPGDGSGSESDGKSEMSGSESDIPKYEKTGTSQQEVAAVPLNGHVVAIDAGHQAKANAEKEPIGPESSTMKAKMPEGAVGTATGVKEYELTLTVAKKLETELKARGYEVVMIRTGHDVNLSNAERSVIANESDAEIFIRLHANSMDNSGIYGALAMCMTEYNPYNSELHANSYDLSKKIINNICALTGTKNRGVQQVDNSSAINWCEIPVSVVEMGFLTNPDEDRWLQSEEYQGKIVEGIAKAIDSYFAEEN